MDFIPTAVLWNCSTLEFQKVLVWCIVSRGVRVRVAMAFATLASTATRLRCRVRRDLLVIAGVCVQHVVAMDVVLLYYSVTAVLLLHAVTATTSSTVKEPQVLRRKGARRQISLVHTAQSRHTLYLDCTTRLVALTTLVGSVRAATCQWAFSAIA